MKITIDLSLSEFYGEDDEKEEVRDLTTVESDHIMSLIREILEEDCELASEIQDDLFRMNPGHEEKGVTGMALNWIISKEGDNAE